MSNHYEEFQGFKDPTSNKEALYDARQCQKTQQLFVETLVNKDVEPLYSLREYDHKGYISAYQIYMHSIDETDAALKLVGSLRHWRKLLKTKWFMKGTQDVMHDGLEQWRKDMAARDASIAKGAVLQRAKAGDANSARQLKGFSEEANPPEPKLTAKEKQEQAQQSKRDKQLTKLFNNLNAEKTDE